MVQSSSLNLLPMVILSCFVVLGHQGSGIDGFSAPQSPVPPQHDANLGDVERSSSYLSSRRDVMALGLIFPTALLYPRPSMAIGEGSERMVFRQTPSAPLSALLPAIQQRLLLEAIRELAKGLPDADDKRRQQIQSVLLPLSETKQSDYKLMKQYSTSKVLSGALVRASMNIYTANLNYGAAASSDSKNPADVYDVTDPQWKKAYIRANDGLPDVKRVIVADLDLRDLYRNEVQQKLDDASAEWYSSSCELKEFQGLLQEAASSFDAWLDRISEKDVQAAIQAVLDGKELKLQEPFAAGFLPKTVTTTD